MAETGQTLRVEFSTHSLTTGELAAPDALPTAVLRQNGTTVAAASVTVSNLSTGRYLATVLLDAAHGWEVGDSYALDLSWAMGGVAVGGPVAQGMITQTAALLARLLGLAQDNWVMDDAVYDLAGNLTAATLYVYDSAANATTHDGSTGLLYRWTLTATFSGGQLTLAKQLRAL